MVLALILAGTAFASTRVSVSAAIALAQCDGGDGPGSVIACDVTVVNSLNLGTGATSSTVTVARQCAGTNVDCVPTNGTTTTSNQLVSSVDQCNNAGNGGGSTLTCRVTITNNITNNTTATPATVNQCNGSGDNLGAPTVICDPFPASTTGADITQCNNSANGGTLVGLNCTVSPGSTTAAALRVTVNQCNGSDNGGGSKVICSVKLTNNVNTTSPTATPTPGSGGGTPPPGSGGGMPPPGSGGTPPPGSGGGTSPPGSGGTTHPVVVGGRTFAASGSGSGPFVSLGVGKPSNTGGGLPAR